MNSHITNQTIIEIEIDDETMAKLTAFCQIKNIPIELALSVLLESEFCGL